MAPELFGSTCKFSTSSDVYAFSMLMVEAITGKVPWSSIALDGAVVVKVNAGYRPEDFRGNREYQLTPQWRTLIEHCWDQDASHRLDILSVVQELDNIIHRSTPTSFRTIDNSKRAAPVRQLIYNLHVYEM